MERHCHRSLQFHELQLIGQEVHVTVRYGLAVGVFLPPWAFEYEQQSLAKPRTLPHSCQETNTVLTLRGRPDFAQDLRRFVVLSAALLAALAVLVLLALVPAEVLLRRWALPLGLLVCCCWLAPHSPGPWPKSTSRWWTSWPQLSWLPSCYTSFFPLKQLAALPYGPVEPEPACWPPQRCSQTGTRATSAIRSAAGALFLGFLFGL
ncbi:hypothetical protein MRX96_027416 [Rhipicephalus microplus]